MDEVQVIDTCDLRTDKKNDSPTRGNLKAGALKSLDASDAAARSEERQEKYPLEKPGGVYVNHAAPLRHRHGAVVAVVFADDLAVDKHGDQGALREPPHVGLSGGKQLTCK